MLDNDLSHRPRRRTALVDLELEKIGADIAALQEVRLADEGQIREAGRTFYWRGVPEGQPRRAGVAFVIRNEIAAQLDEQPKGISERIMTLRVRMAPNRYITLVNVYAPTMTYPEEEKEAFYSQLRTLITNVPEADKLILLGDFNARVGNDHNTWGPVLGKFGKGNQNSNGELLACLCSELELAVTNTYFDQPDHHYYSWTHPRSKRPHLLDYVIIRRRDLKDLRCTRAMRGPDCYTDHYMIKSTFKFAIAKTYSITGQQRKRRLNVAQLADPNKQQMLERKIDAAVEACPDDSASLNETWNALHTSVYQAAADTLGYTKKHNADWFSDNDQEIKLAIEQRNNALKAKLSNPCIENVEKLKNARAKLQRDMRRMEDEWWLGRAEDMQKQADGNNSAGFFRAMKEVYGPQAKMSNALLDKEGTTVITEPARLIKRWEEYFRDLLNVEANTDDTILDQIPRYAVRGDLDATPSREEVSEARDRMKSGKAPGEDGIPAEIFKHGGIELTDKLHQLIVKCWQQGQVPQGSKDVSIIPIFKNKGDHRDCNNYRGISLLAIAGKIMAKIAQCRLAKLAEEVLTEAQCGFRRERSTIDMVFSLRQLQEKAIEQHRELYIVFIDFRKAFDTVDRALLWKVLTIFGCPPKLAKLTQEFHEGTRGKVVVGGEESGVVLVNHGTKQGCVLAPTLFTLFLTVVLLVLHQETEEGVYVRTRIDGKLFNLARLKARTKTKLELITELLFADDTALVAHSEQDMQKLVDTFSAASERMGLGINTSKTEVLYQPSPENTSPQEPSIQVSGETLKVVSSFKYLGSTITSDNRVDKEVSCRIRNACASYGKMEKKLWTRPGIRLSTKCKVYKAVVLPALLYSAETYTLYRGHIRRLEAVQQRHLRRVMNIKSYDRISNMEVLGRAGMESVEAVLAATQLRWIGHVARMENSRIPKQILYGELAQGRRKVGGQKLRYKDVAKRHMKAMNIDYNNWEEHVSDRSEWRRSLHKGRETIHLKLKSASDARHYQRHNPGLHRCSTCGRTFHSERGLLQHRRMMHRPPT